MGCGRQPALGGVAEGVDERCQRLKLVLVETATPLKFVGPESGFSDSDHFYKDFVRSEGISPSDYRPERQQVSLLNPLPESNFLVTGAKRRDFVASIR